MEGYNAKVVAWPICAASPKFYQFHQLIQSLTRIWRNTHNGIHRSITFVLLGGLGYAFRPFPHPWSAAFNISTGSSQIQSVRCGFWEWIADFTRWRKLLLSLDQFPALPISLDATVGHPSDWFALPLRVTWKQIPLFAECSRIEAEHKIWHILNHNSHVVDMSLTLCSICTVLKLIMWQQRGLSKYQLSTSVWNMSLSTNNPLTRSVCVINLDYRFY